MSYIETFPNHRQQWVQVCNIRHGPICNIGSKVRLTTENKYINQELHQYFGDKTYTVASVIRKKWELMPCDNYLILTGIQGMFLNTIFENG